MKPPFSYLPMLPAAAGIVAGILMSQFPYAAMCIVACIALFAVLYLFKRHYLSFFPLMAAVGIISSMAYKPATATENLLESKRRFSAEVLRSEIGPATTKCVIEVDSCDGGAITPFKCMAYAHDVTLDIEPGSRISMDCEIYPLSDASRLVPHEVDYERYLKYDGIVAIVHLYEGSTKIISEPYGWHRAINSIRNSMFDGIVTSPINGQTAAFLLAVVLGDDVFMNSDVSDRFRVIGISHMLALSGLHVGIISSLLALLLFPLKLHRMGLWLRPLMVIILIWLYSVVVGMEASVVRAAVMLTAFLLAQIVQRGSNPFNSLCLAATALLVFRPYSLFTPGFQLSFAAVLSILLFAPILPKKLQRRPVLYFCLNMLIVPIAAMLGTGLVSAYYFNCMPWLFLAANIIAGLIFPWVLSFGIILMILTMAGLRFALLGSITNFLCLLIDKSSVFLSSLGLHTEGVFFSAWVFIPYFLGIIALSLLIRKVASSDKEDGGTAKSLPSALFLSLSTAALFIMTMAIAWGVRERIPQAEVYIPTGVPTAMIARTGQSAYIIGIDANTDSAQILKAYDRRFRSFLQSRKCEGFQFMPDSVAIGPFFYHNNNLIANDKLISIINISHPTIRNAKSDYAVVGDGFKSWISVVQEAARPDTILISQGVKGQRAKRLMGECGDSIPYQRLGKSVFALVIE